MESVKRKSEGRISTRIVSKGHGIVLAPDVIFEAFSKHLIDNTYNSLVQSRDSDTFEGQFFDTDNKNSIRFRTTKDLPSGKIVESLKSIGISDFDINLISLPIDDDYVHTLHFRTREPISESLKFSNKGTGTEIASLKIPANKKEEFITDVCRKFSLKTYTKYGMEIYGTHSAENMNKYYILKSVDGKIYACLNAKFDKKVHRDIDAFRKYVETAVEKYIDKDKEEEKSEKDVNESADDLTNPALQKYIIDSDIPVNPDDVSRMNDTRKNEFYIFIDGAPGYYVYKDRESRNQDFDIIKNIISTGDKGIGNGTKPKISPASKPVPAPAPTVDVAEPKKTMRLPDVLSDDEPLPDNIEDYKPKGSTKKPSGGFSIQKVKDAVFKIMDKVDVQLAYALIFNTMAEYSDSMKSAILQKAIDDPDNPNVNYVLNAYIKESGDNLISTAIMKDVVGIARAWDIISSEKNISFGISENGIIHKFKKVSEGYLVETMPLEIDDLDGDGVDDEEENDEEIIDDVMAELEPGDEIVTDDDKVVFFIDLGNGAMLVVAPDVDSAQIAMSSLMSPANESKQITIDSIKQIRKSKNKAILEMRKLTAEKIPVFESEFVTQVDTDNPGVRKRKTVAKPGAAAGPAAVAKPGAATGPDTGVKKLPMNYPNDDMIMVQVERTDKAAMYKSQDDDIWEVFKVNVMPAKTIHPKGVEKRIPAREKVPGNEEFGLWAWSYSDEAKAREKYDELNGTA